MKGYKIDWVVGSWKPMRGSTYALISDPIMNPFVVLSKNSKYVGGKKLIDIHLHIGSSL